MADDYAFPDDILSSLIPSATALFPIAQETTPPSPSPDPDSGDDDLFEQLATGTKAGVAMAIVIGIVLIIILSAWFCCNCCGYRKRKVIHNNPRVTSVLPLHTMQTQTQAPPAPVAQVVGTQPRELPHPHPHLHPHSDAPPAYEEVVRPQPQQHRITTDLPHTSEEDSGVVADGKTPLSEIPFEDVVLDHASSQSSSSRTFEQTHHGLGGDTRGHTNS